MRHIRAAAIAAALALHAWPAAAAPDSCAFFTRAEFDAAVGRPSIPRPFEPMELAGGIGQVCDYAQGQVILYAGPDGPAAWERMMKRFGVTDPVKAPAEGLGEGAHSFPFKGPTQYQPSGIFVVFFKGDHTAVVTVYAADGAPPESALEPALALARTMYGELP